MGLSWCKVTLTCGEASKACLGHVVRRMLPTLPLTKEGGSGASESWQVESERKPESKVVLLPWALDEHKDDDDDDGKGRDDKDDDCRVTGDDDCRETDNDDDDGRG